MEENKIHFELTTEYIMLNQLLKATGLAQTGGHAKILISEGEVLVNGTQEFRLRNKIRKGDQVEVDGAVVLVA